MQGVILSHTKMGASNRGFCTNIAIRNPDGTYKEQIRPRLKPNGNLFIEGFFGYRGVDLDTYWQPLRVVEVPGYEEIEPAHRRVTHPEDRILTGRPQMINQVLEKQEFLNFAYPMFYQEVNELFPTIIRSSNGKAYIQERDVLERSVGYVTALAARFDSDELLTFADQGKVQYSAKIKDTQILTRLASGELAVGGIVRDVLLRLSIANPFSSEYFSGERGYLMVSHILE